MIFSDNERVIYKKNPLNQVICQLRFPTILAINSEAPTGFQEKIRKQFPFYNSAPSTLSPNNEIPAELLKLANKGLANTLQHNFVTEEPNWQISLNKDFISLSAGNYKKWEEFKTKLEEPLKAFIEEYEPNFFTRIGLRYQNVISRSDLGLKDTPWSKLLSKHIANELSMPEIESRIKHKASDLIIKLEDDIGNVRIQHGFVNAEGREEQLYLIDADYYIDEKKVNVNDTLDQLTYLHKYSQKLFRGCIQDALHNAMQPTEP